MAYTQAHLDKLDEAIAQGASAVEFADGSRIERRTPAELLVARAHVAAALAEAAAISTGVSRPRRLLMGHARMD